jgi:phage FluMu protein gp41
MDKHEHKIILPFGLESKEGDEPIRRFVFGKRPAARDSIKIEDDKQSEFETQRQLLFARAAITEFGEKKRAPHLTELLELTRVDREALMEGYVTFLEETYEDRTSEKIDTDTLLLAFGLKDGDDVYHVVTLCDKGSMLTGYDELKIERESGGGYEHACALAGYDIARLSQTVGEKTIEGPISLEMIKSLDAVDLGFLMSAIAERRSLFRKSRKAVSANTGAASSTDSGKV